MPLDLTANQVCDLKPGRHRVASNLYLDHRPPNRRSWVMIYTSPVTGKRAEMGLGSTDVISVGQAKATVLKHRASILEGHCPLAERRAAREARSGVTFRQCVDAFFTAHAGSWRSARHPQQWLQTMTDYVLPALGNRPVRAIATGDVMEVLEGLWRRTPETGSRVRGRIEQILDFATSRHWREGDNPARWRGHLEHILPKARKLKARKHMTALPWKDVPALWRDLSMRQQTIPVLALRLIMLTGVRSNEALSARWDEINLDDRLWILPAGRTKTQREHRVPLSDAAMTVLRLAGEVRTGELIFPGRRHDHPIAGARLLEVLKALCPGAATTHGFRSTIRDWCAEHGVSGEVAEAILAHAVSNGTEAAYRRTDLLEPRRGVMEQWGRFVTGVRGDVDGQG
jgi:integrase